MRRKTVLRLAGAGVLTLVLAGIAAPYVRADRYGEDIRNGLQRALGRKVEILGDVSFNLFTGPGFAVNKVVIADDPSAGIEPFASMELLEARVSLLALLLGRIEFSTVRFVEPYVNLVKRDGKAWNIVPLLQRAPQAGGAELPVIQVSRGRFNFKFNDTKSAFYVNDSDVTISRASTKGSYEIRFDGEPARTDRAARGFGSFRGRGIWIAGPDGSRLDLDLQLERSSIDEIATLVRGDAVGIHGVVASRLRVSGPVGRLKLEGRVELDDVHRWDLLQSRVPGAAINVKGICDLHTQVLELEAPREINPGLSLVPRLEVSNLLSSPRWSSTVEIIDLPAPSLIGMMRHMGAPFPMGVGIEGNVAGQIAYASVDGLRGDLQLIDGTLKVGKNSRLRLPQAEVTLENGQVRLLPSRLVGEAGQEGILEALYTPHTGAVEATITGRRLRISDLHGETGGLLGGRALPLAQHFSGGLWNGSLHYHQPDAREGAWTGKFSVRDTAARIPGFSDPVKLSSASIELQPNRLAVKGLHAAIGEIEVFGEYRYEPAEDRPHRLNISIPAADLAELEKLFSPTLDRSGNLLARTLRFRQPTAPEWLRERRAEGIVRIGSLTAGEFTLRGVRSHLLWAGSTIQFGDVSAKLDDATVNGSVTANLAGREPRYRMRGNIQNWTWSGGKLDLTGQLATSGIGNDLLLNLTSEGGFQARSIAIAPDQLLRSASGTFELTMARTGPQIKLASMQAVVGGERFSGEGATQSDGKLAIDLASAGRTMHLVSPVVPLHLEVIERSAAR